MAKFLRVWAKNQLRFEIFQKILIFKYENLNGKLNFYQFSSDPPGPLSFYTALENNTIFYNIFSVSGDLLPLPPAGDPVFYIHPVGASYIHKYIFSEYVMSNFVEGFFTCLPFRIQSDGLKSANLKTSFHIVVLAQHLKNSFHT